MASVTVGPSVPGPGDSDPLSGGFTADPVSTDRHPVDIADPPVSLSPTQVRKLMAAADTIGRGGTVDDVAAALVDSGVLAVHGTKGVVALVDDTDTYLQLVAFSGYEPGYVSAWQRFPITTDIPLAQAVRTGQHVVVPSVDEFRRRYPDVRLPDEQPHALVAVPLQVETRTVGAWGIRLDTRPDQEGERIAAATVGSQYLGNVAAAGITRAATVELLEERVGQLQHALSSRISIEQAKGILSERHGLTTDQAFDALRRYARNNGRRLRDVAADVVDGDLDPLSPDTHDGSESASP
jgi:transcriptional regulator with GAF, ATPase, and Fis domain